jgi:hypothetical protein
MCGCLSAETEFDQHFPGLERVAIAVGSIGLYASQSACLLLL